ncbi:hypothetical protein CPB84DRAFT_1687354 [Gymnopilus junonius]|uniref:MADS-box domain-containing protein n=1 Tax=Gymnopilus junonius TaxID=109634 RepID=A0A9P5TIP9_GYMJU|nr:hypothetical protein CPB84DRAFT_1687354 [Gymnopilus junonius]
MGRRKIEIQPITVSYSCPISTFCSRKNGLFKKAYELGVLCSVDVAVIVFGALAGPGHDAKLHLYSSTNIRNIVQRQIQHQGEEDIKGPADFSGAGGATGADDGEDDDAAGNDEDAEKCLPLVGRRGEDQVA